MSTRIRLTALAATVFAALLPAGGGLAAEPRQTADVYGYADFYGVPHLGTETASGTGCGGDGSIGDVIPDGYWRGFVRSFGTTALDFDLVCVYGNDVNPQLIADWAAQHPGEPQPWVPDGFMVNNNSRIRSVVLSPAFFAHGTAWAGTSCPFNNPATPFDQSRDTWIRIVNGQALWAVSSCAGVPGGGQPTAPALGFTFPYATFYDVPRLGDEEVLGSGCGGNGTLGDTIPDGIWFGWISSLGPTSMELDVACIYIGQSAARLQAEWEASPEQQADDPSPYFQGGFWLVNNNARTRTVPLSPGYVPAFAHMSDPANPHPNWPPIPGFEYACVPPVDPTIPSPFMGVDQISLTGSWVMISGGQAQYSLSECPHD